MKLVYLENLQSFANKFADKVKSLVDKKIADLIDGAPETLDTLKEVADAIEENEDVVSALNAAIGTKASQSQLNSHVSNDVVHISSAERANWNLCGTIKELNGASNIQYSYPDIESDSIIVNSGAESLTVAIKDSTQKLSETVIEIKQKLNNGDVSQYALKSEIASYNSLYSGFSISGTGWHRVAEFRYGDYANSCGIILKSNNEYHYVEFLATNNKFNFIPVFSQCNVQVITKMRFTYIPSTKVSYIEIYYDSSVQNNLQVSTENGYCFGSYWRPLSSPMLVLESIEGVTVGASIDLPAKIESSGNVPSDIIDVSECIVDITNSEDEENPTSYVKSFPILSGTFTLRTLFHNISVIFKNMRYLLNKLEDKSSIPWTDVFSTTQPTNVACTIYKSSGSIIMLFIIKANYEGTKNIPATVKSEYRPAFTVYGIYSNLISSYTSAFINSAVNEYNNLYKNAKITSSGSLNISIYSASTDARTKDIYVNFIYPLKF